MGSPYFRFKQFTVWHDRCAMKVGTDGVLLGAWAKQEHVHKVLDIGTGSGLIALMLAQRFQDAEITGIDIDPSAAEQATDNFQLSPWSHRLHARCIDLHTFSQEYEHFDLIVSNPPYFSASLKNPNQQRATARHNDSLPHDMLLGCSSRLLSADGHLCVILPADQTDCFIDTAKQFSLYAHHIVWVHPTPQNEPKRILLSLGKDSATPLTEHFIIESGGRHQYSEEYKQLTAAFYLDK